MKTDLRKTLRLGRFDAVSPVDSSRMSKIHSKNTKPEKALARIIDNVYHGKVILNNRKLLGCPDIHLPSLRLVIFVDGCFFHGCGRHGHIPNKNHTYWKKKLESNQKRDRSVNEGLRRMGFHVWRLWEHRFLTPLNIVRTGKSLSKRLSNLSELNLREAGAGHKTRRS